MKVIFLKQYNTDGTHRYKRGEIVELTDKTAEFLAQLGVVRLEVEMESPKRHYKRRDMKAEG